MVERVIARTGTAVEEDTDIRLQNGAEGLEKPSVGIDFLLILLLETEDHLTWHDSLLSTTTINSQSQARLPELQLGVDADLGRVFVNVSLNRFSVDCVFGDTVLVDSHGSKGSQSAGINPIVS